MKKVIVIPARLNSSRLPNKILLDLKGKAVIQRVYERCVHAKTIDEVYIATDSHKVKTYCESFTGNIIMTKDTHESGTDRIAEAIKNITCDVVINVQGDEPFIEAELIDELSNSFENKEVKMASVMHKIESVDVLKNHNVVKVTVDKCFNALYFSRSIIPYHRDGWESLINHHTTIPEPLIFYRHLGIYGYTKKFLLEYSILEPTYLEKVEKLEQLRVLENGYKIKMVETSYDSIGIDTIDDYNKALEFLK
ncbi:3-deoxy-manno-octulosonate cytidylyltransferase [Halarcobacter anaerophilus]|uniref:3-deoxy-manno-octulosonate cytidylyltransferase n=1 Tax=Halarcobacter anaerophilus TaxID=877500 RepID=UPI0005C87452|nr:3-deoxy-manno-octulosonate cytidylyltransferase [Halarcobacter anaerophilus]